jgi:YHS domain-containing protein
MKAFLILLITVLGTTCTFAQTEAQRKQHFNTKKSIALEGYDPVSYFSGKPKEGKSEYRITHHGVIYQFSSTANLNTFKSNPTKYEPAYGGWCAYAMGENGEKVKIDPETYKIIDNKLYLFYNFWGNNTLTDWNKLEKKLKESADRNWEKLIKGK